MIVFKTSMGPAKVLDLSWSLEKKDKKNGISGMIGGDALDLDKLEWNDNKGFSGS